MSRNATTLNLHYYSVWCQKCKNNIDIAVSEKDDINDHVCSACGYKMESDFATPYSKQEISLEYIFSFKHDSDVISNQSDGQKMMSENIISSLYNLQKAADEELIEKYDLESLLNDLKEKDPCVAKLIDLHCFKGYSIKDAAKEVGLSGMGASLKLKNLKRKLKVKETFGR
jgi:Zn ribbon nucleic-acid-binding protein